MLPLGTPAAPTPCGPWRILTPLRRPASCYRKRLAERESAWSGSARKSARSSGSRARSISRLHPKSVRVRPRRRTGEIDLPTAWDVRRAIQHAIHLRRPINRHLAVCWQLAGVSDGLEATGRLMKLICDGARRRGHRISYLWVRETGQIVGHHVHILFHLFHLFHLPEPLVGWYRKRKSGWLKRCGATFTEGTSRMCSVQGLIWSPNRASPVPRRTSSLTGVKVAERLRDLEGRSARTSPAI